MQIGLYIPYLCECDCKWLFWLVFVMIENFHKSKLSSEKLTNWLLIECI